MENSKIKEHLIEANISRLKYISLISLGFSFWVLFTDFVVQGIWRTQYLYLYKVLDIVFTFVSITAVAFFWLFKNKNSTLQKAGIFIFPFLLIIWSAVITGIDFSFLGFSTFLIVVLSATFFLYISLRVSIVYFSTSCLTLLTLLYFQGGLEENLLPLLFLVFPTIIISILISARNYKSKLNDLFNSEKMAEMNFKLQYSNQHLEIEIEKRTKEIRVALEKAEVSDRLKSAFLANMSHEIRTPMNGILGFADLLKEPGLTGEEHQAYIKIIEKSGTRMLHIINDIVDISKIEAGMMEVNKKESNINEQIEYIYTFFKPEAEAKGITLSFKNDLPAPAAIIQTDREKLFAILTNLVKNALKYTDNGSIEFGYVIKTNKSVGDPVELEFFVKDTGIGIPKDKQDLIFKRFIQADIEDKMARQGAGLGLSISKAYVEMLGGKIWVESEVGVGSTFYFTLPFNAEPVIKREIPAETAENQINPKVSGLKILIVEDDETAELLLDIIVRKHGKEILKAETGIEAVDICRNHPDIDLILMDIQMPEMGGYEATRQIRQFNKEVVILAQTAFGLSGDREKAMEAGCNDYISKPIKKEELVGLIEKYFN